MAEDSKKITAQQFGGLNGVGERDKLALKMKYGIELKTEKQWRVVLGKKIVLKKD